MPERLEDAPLPSTHRDPVLIEKLVAGWAHVLAAIKVQYSIIPHIDEIAPHQLHSESFQQLRKGPRGKLKQVEIASSMSTDIAGETGDISNGAASVTTEQG